MSEHEHEDLPEDLRQTAEWLRAQRPELTGHDLDRLRSRITARTGAASSGLGFAARSRRTLTTGLAALVLAGGLGGAFAIAGKGPPSSPGNSGSSHGNSAASSQYKPGKGCGDKNHVHEREDECKKPPK